ncbi:ketopantoate reductase family protein [Xanthovirga aplysinae]|uniref:ketopantoate reductase family protein n=1 Tax=Xanthovirga aplysinae TaxID=2529853 RepID=UPI0012BD5515|nr:ketopantoate reductase family protein [Xanthovirga aplysinae]MTI31665.1 ketopantoate reductase family protein [Xanthovirga aplysinae]
MAIRNICVFGIGGVGGYFGGLLSNTFDKNDGKDVYFVARGEHLKAIQEKGLEVHKGNERLVCHPTLCTDNPEELPACDLIILSVKSYGLDEAIRQLRPIIHENTVILPLLNGMDIYERIRKNLSTAYVLPACVYIVSFIDAPGIIAKKGSVEKILMGQDPAKADFPQKDDLFEVLSQANIHFEWPENVYTAIWTKFTFIAGLALVTGCYRKSVGEVMADVNYRSEFEKVMKEIKGIAKKLNIPLAPNMVEDHLKLADSFPFEGTTSFLRDLESGRSQNEGDLFGGAVIRMGRELGVPVSFTEKVYSKISE